VLIHVGFAMQRVDEDEAARTLALLREIGEIHARGSGEEDPSQAGSAAGTGEVVS
jgi:hydrogenase expression/formation protein HypC